MGRLKPGSPDNAGGAGFDVVYDSVGGENMSKSFEAATLNGQVVTTVSMLELDLTPAHFKGLSIHVVFMLIPMLHDFNRGAHGAILSELAKVADSGELKPLLDEQRFTLEQAGDAHEPDQRRCNRKSRDRCRLKRPLNDA
nr:zinc-binding dehydrogenase [uncultured Hyphomonas sp.]